MPDDDGWKQLKERLKFYGQHGGNIAIDLLFFVLWVISQWGVNKYVVEPLEFHGDIDRYTLQAFQIIFALSTAVPVVLYIIEDLLTILLRWGRKVRRIIRTERNRTDDPDD